MDSKPTATYEEIVDANINILFGLLSDFDGWIKWWPMYASMEAFTYVLDPSDPTKKIKKVLEGDDVPKNGGYYRGYVSLDNTSYVEYFQALDQPYTLRYDFVSVDPVPLQWKQIESVSSQVVLEKIDDDKTKVIWSSVTKFAAGTSEADEKNVFASQISDYQHGIKFAFQFLVMAKVWKGGLDVLQERVMSMTKALLVGQNPVWAYEDTYKDKETGEIKPFPRSVRGLPVSEALPPTKVGRMLGRFLEVGYLQAADLVFEKSAKAPAGTDLYKVAAKQVADTYGKKDIQYITDYLFSHANEDSELCQQTLQGPNPLQIQLIRSINEVPQNMRHFKPQEKELSELIAEKRLFLLDYKELIGLQRANVMFFKAPIVLVYKEILNGDSQLKIVCIQLERKEGATLYTPNSNPILYKLAKLFVTCADNQVHEFRYHLGLSHLGMEPVIIAIHNAFEENHPIRKLLKPHLEETIGINFLARQTLIAPVGAFTNNTFAVGTAQGVEIASRAWRDYDFYKFSFPENLKARGFDDTDGLEGYYYRDDGWKVWNAIGDYARGFVDHHYPHETDVSSCKIIQGWAHEMSAKDRAAIPGFRPEIKSKKELSEILQIIIWNGSCLHSILNFPQWPYLGYVPNRPNGLYLDMPESADGIGPEYIKQALLPKFATAFQIAFSWLLTLPSSTNLLGLAESQAKDQKEDHYAKKFHHRLVEITHEINKRNEDLKSQGKNPYIFLLPENVAASVDI